MLSTPSLVTVGPNSGDDIEVLVEGTLYYERGTIFSEPKSF